MTSLIFCILVGLLAVLVVAWLLSADGKTLIDRCGVEVITPEDFSTSGAAPIPEGKRIVYLPAPGEYRAERRTPKSAEDRTCTIDDNAASASRYEAINFGPSELLTQLLASGALRKI